MRRHILTTFAAGASPTRVSVAQALGLDDAQVAASYAALDATHVVVLERDTGEAWMAMPFSAVPTAFRVVVGGRSVWANCAWDAFGIAAAMSCDVSIATYCLDCGAAMAYGVRGGELTHRDGVVHFAVPASQWWDDIGFT